MSFQVNPPTPTFKVRPWFLLWTLCCAAFVSSCIESNNFQGVYLEEVALNENGEYEQDFAMRLDLFQFGSDVGGIVRYYRTDLAVEGESPFDQEEVVCFWTRKDRVGDALDSFRVSFEDLHKNTSVLLLSDLAGSGLVLEGMRYVQGERDRVEAPLDERRMLIMNRSEGVVSNSNCFNPLVDFSFVTQFRNEMRGLREEANTNADPRPTLAMAWSGDSRFLEPLDWYRRFAQINGDIVTVSRELQPGGVMLQRNEIPYVPQAPGEARIAVGQLFAFQDENANAQEEISWQRQTEPVLGSGFVLDEVSSLRKGRVLIYVDGEPSELPGYVLALLEPGQSFQQGYWVYEVEASPEDGVIRSIRRVSDQFRIDVFPCTSDASCEDLQFFFVRFPLPG